MTPKYFIKFNRVLETKSYSQFENTLMYDCIVECFDNKPITVHKDCLFSDKRNALSKLIRELKRDLVIAESALKEAIEDNN